MGVEVLAPSDTVWAHSDGKLTIGPKSYINNGKWNSFKPKKEDINMPISSEGHSFGCMRGSS